MTADQHTGDADPAARLDATGPATTGPDDAATVDPHAVWKPEPPESAGRSASIPEVVDAVATETRADDSEDAGDSPWSSASDVRFDHRPITIPERSDSDSEGPESGRRGRRGGGDSAADGAAPAGRRRGRFVAIALVAVAGLIVAGVLVRGLGVGDVGGSVDPASASAGAQPSARSQGPEPLVTEPFAGADPRRLPASLAQQWTTSVEGVEASSNTEVVVEGADVYALFDSTPDAADASDVDAGAPGGSVVVALDPATGAERWRTPIASTARSLSILGVVNGVVVLERLDADNRSILGIDAVDGSIGWERQSADPGIHVVLEGASVVVLVSFTGNARLTFTDPVSGEVVSRLPGRLVATDFLGTWYLRNGAEVSRLELADGWNEPTPLGTLWVANDDVVSVVDETLIAIDGGFLEVLDADGEPKRSATVGAGSGGFAGLDSAPLFSRLSPMVDESFILTGNNSVFGAALQEDGDVDIRWRASGAPIDTQPTDRGLTLLVASEGGASQRVLDGSTGREIAVVPMVPGAVDTLELVGNGIVLKRAASFGFERVALDLDGNLLWTLVGEGPIAIGDGVVVAYGPTDDGVTVTAYTDG